MGLKKKKLGELKGKVQETETIYHSRKYPALVDGPYKCSWTKRHPEETKTGNSTLYRVYYRFCLGHSCQDVV